MVPQDNQEHMLPANVYELKTPPVSRLDDLAARIFVKTYMDTAGKTPDYLAKAAYNAAEAFIRHGESRS